MLTSEMVGGSYKFSDLLKKKKKTKKKKSKGKKGDPSKLSGDPSKLSGDPSKLGYHAKRTNLNIIMKGSDGNLYKNKRYKKTKRWARVQARVKAKRTSKK